MGLYDILSVVLALIAVLAMILLSRNGWQFVTKFGANRSRMGSIAIESTLTLDPKRRLRVIRWEGQQILLLTGGANDLVLASNFPFPDTASSMVVEEQAP
ncbi:hypothetical protein [Acetobacter conturbans]|uniref:hypothetical protein n=1 Tax=Acetobacter conturbans TaxID=1737472 RepID=UPI001F55AA08|nr:hypothetical protein [Acetobacter conturbans]